MKFLSTLAGVIFCLSAPAQSLFDKEINALLNPSLKPFYFGVASGDPQQQQVVIWTKVWSEGTAAVPVKWEVATDTLFQNIVAEGELKTEAASAFTVKILVQNLQPNTTYFYRFTSNGAYSPVGRTRTTPVEADSLRLAVVSCSHYEAGFFNAYGLLAQRNDLNAIIHLGDYIYEGSYAGSKKPGVRQHIPAREILTLQDYRSRYAQYRLDSNLQEAHRLHPFIAVWDDHEFANNAYKDGAGNHQTEKGDWEERKERARKVYFEWLPITDNEKESIIRKISYGNLADLFMLDGRTEGRFKQCATPQDAALADTNRTMLGKEQSSWLTTGIQNSTARWKVIGNQVIFSEVDAHKLSKKYAINPDAWDGYPCERKAILDFFYQHNLKNIIIITGDIHTSWAFDLVQDPRNKSSYDAKTGKGVIGAEFVAPSVTSSNLSAKLPRGLAQMLGGLLKKKATNPHLRFLNVVDHGYLLLDLNNEQAKGTWYFCKTVLKPTYKVTSKNSWVTKYNENRLVKKK
jgi:alkaline phosphatase D